MRHDNPFFQGKESTRCVLTLFLFSLGINFGTNSRRLLSLLIVQKQSLCSTLFFKAKELQTTSVLEVTFCPCEKLFHVQLREKVWATLPSLVAEFFSLFFSTGGFLYVQSPIRVGTIFYNSFRVFCTHCRCRRSRGKAMHF